MMHSHDEQLPLAGGEPDPTPAEHDQGHFFPDVDQSPPPSAPSSPPPPPAAGEDGTLIMVDPSDIDPSPTLGRRTHDAEAHHALTESIRAEGRILTPVTGMRMPDGRIQLKDGHARVDAARELGILVPVYLWTTDPVTAMVEAIRSNDVNSGTAYAKGCRYRALQALVTRLEGADQASTRKLGRRIGVAHTVISEHVNIAEMLTVELAERAEVDFGVAAALDKATLLRISRLPDIDAQARALCRLIHGRAPSWSGSTQAAPQDVRAQPAYRIREHRDGSCSVTYDPAMSESQAARMIQKIREQLRAARDAQADDAAAA